MPRSTNRASGAETLRRRASHCRPSRRRGLAAAACTIALASCAVGLAAGTLSVAAQSAPDALAAGREKFVQCASCHGADGRSTVVPQYPKIGGQTAEYVVNALKAYRDGRRLGTYAAMMAAVAKQLSDADIANLAVFVESLDASH